MKKIYLVPLIVLSFLLARPVQATLLLEDQFIGYGSGDLGTDATTGTLNGWQLPTSEITLVSGSGSLNGTNLGLVVSDGDRVFISANDENCRNQFVPGGTFPQSTETNIYYSWLYKFNDAADVEAGGELISRVTRGNSGTGNDHHWNIIAKNVAGQIQLGLSKAGGTATNYATNMISAGETFFLVVRQHIIPGTTNDIYDLWINPPPASFGADEENIPASSATIEEGAEDQSGTGPGRYVIWSGANAEYDEVRIATTWAEATPFFGQCVSAGVLSDPESVAQSAELSATFEVTVRGTSPSIQWQVSEDGGSNWDDIPLANSSSYTTPNLPLDADGNQYRAVVSVGCDSSSATSAVAIVTLTAPIETPVGVIMNDTFLDPDLGFDDRANPPLTSSNSLWYTQLTDNLTAFQQGGNMVGIPETGSSCLWLGYFIDTNTPPVHLAVGRSIKITLPFTLSSFNLFEENSGLRFGLFDYFDSGNRITQDGSDAGGSQGLGNGVRGYMVNWDFGTNYNDTTPIDIMARDFLPDNNLMGTTADYVSLGSGPEGGVTTNTPSFQAGVPYTLELTVSRTGVDTVVITASISDGTTTWSHSVTDSQYAYHRFDSFGIRIDRIERSADMWTISDFIVEVEQGLVSVPAFSITDIEALSPTSVRLTWDSVSGATYHVLTRDSITGTETTNGTVVATGNSTSFTNSPTTSDEAYYRVVAPPYAP